MTFPVIPFLFNKDKANALDVFKIYKTKQKNQLEKKIHIVRSTHGREYHGKYDESCQLMGPSAIFIGMWDCS